MPAKGKLLTIRIPEKFLNEYRQFCEDNSWIMSKRIRRMMESDLTRWGKYVEEQKKKAQNG